MCKHVQTYIYMYTSYIIMDNNIYHMYLLGGLRGYMVSCTVTINFPPFKL